MPKYRKQFQLLFFISLTALLVLSLTPGNGKILDPFDKVAHFLMYFFLAVPMAGLVNTRQKLTLGIIGCILLGIIIELLQEHIPGRGFEYWDIVANSSGVLFGAYFFHWKKDKLYSWIDNFSKK